MTMQQHPLGRSGLYVSELGLGAMTFGKPGWGCDEATAVELIARFLDAGGNLIDTADGYGASEEILGRALRGRRDDVVVATKFGLPVGAGPHDRGASRIHIMRACDESLRRLGTDRIDLYQLHVDDRSTPLEETLAALDDLVRAGKVLYVGASNLLAYRLMKALAISDRLAASRFVSYQGQYNLVVRELEKEHFPLLRDEGLGFISWSPLAAGLLTGKSHAGVAPSDSRLGQRQTGLESMFMHDRGFTIAEAVARTASAIGCSPAQLALAWQRTKPVTTTILGARTITQLEDNLGSLEVSIPDDALASLDEVSGLPDEYPVTFNAVFDEVLRGGRTLGGFPGKTAP